MRWMCVLGSILHLCGWCRFIKEAEKIGYIHERDHAAAGIHTEASRFQVT